MSKSKFDILQANSRLSYAYICSYHFIFCANEGAAKNNSRTLLSLLFHHTCPPGLPLAYFISLFHKQRMDYCWFHLSHPPGVGVGDHRQRKGGPLAVEGGAGEGCCLQQQPQGFCKLGKLSGRWENRVDRWLSMLLYLAVYKSRLFLLWQSFLT